MKVPGSGYALCRTVLAALALIAFAASETAFAQSRSMNEEYRRDELTRSAESLRQLQQDQPQVFDQILNDINTDQKTRDAVTPDELAASSPALEDLNRSSPEALLGLFLLLKGAAKGEGRK